MSLTDIRHKLSNLPIRQKLTLIVLITSGVLIGMMAAAMTLEKRISFRRNMVESITTLSDVIGTNSTAALTFRDPRTATDTLSALRAEKDIIAACLYDADGKLFAAYYRGENVMSSDETKNIPLNLLEDLTAFKGLTAQSRFIHNAVDLTRPIRLKGKMIGRIVMRADLNELNRAVRLYVLSMVGFSILLFAAAHIICAKLNRSIVGPITGLVTTMQSVSRNQDYSVRVSHKYENEIGVLIGGFNEMLGQIQKRDSEIILHRDRLEELVGKRTMALKQSNDQLKQEIEERKSMQKQLAHAQKMEAIGTLAGGVAHDLNNILSGMVSYPELLLYNMPVDDPMRRPLDIIHTSGKKAATIVQDLLTLARRGVKVTEIVELGALIKDYLKSPEHLKMASFHPKVKVRFNGQDDLHCVKGSPVHLAKTIMNLVSNAFEAMPEGGSVSINVANAQLDAPPTGNDQWRPGPFVRLTVSDTGVGISENDLHRIYEPFYTKKVMGRSGTGLGMAVVWGTIEDHKGHIDAQSKKGSGTTFDIYLPAITDVRANKQQSVDDSVTSGDGERILVVDDSADQRALATDILSSLGYRPQVVPCGEDAVEIIKEKHFELVILDMLMPPGIDGLETYQRIIEIQPGQKAIIASGFSQSARVRKARRLGVSEYVRKPYSLSQISKAVQSALCGDTNLSQS